MNGSVEVRLAWALVDSASGFLDPHERAFICVKIGAGDREGAICDLLRGFIDQKQALPPGLVSDARAWAAGYRGSARYQLISQLIGDCGASFGIASHDRR